MLSGRTPIESRIDLMTIIKIGVILVFFLNVLSLLMVSHYSRFEGICTVKNEMLLTSFCMCVRPK